ncbi:MAG: sulfotransferase domain-containing protein, partial [Chitinophagales bacterium]
MGNVNKEMRWPNFLIVGAARCGTTSLHEHLSAHQDIFMPLQKEPSFFSFADTHPEYIDSKHRYLTAKADYLALFEGRTEKVLGESSTPYLYFYDTTIRNIKKYIPDYQNTKILIILRDPADRAYSQYMHNRRDLREPLTFAEAIEMEHQRKADKWHFDFFYADKGFYYQQVKAYIDNFPHVKVMFFDDLEQQPNRFINEVLQYLEVDPDALKKELQQRNQSGEMKVKWFKKIISNRKNPVLNFFRKLMSREAKKKLRMQVKNLLLKYNLKKVEMDADVRKRLVDLYREDIRQL